jgi:hypothetical protein
VRGGGFYQSTERREASVWSDRSPWEAKRREQAAKVEQLGQLIERYKAGGLSFAKLASQIETVIHGEPERIVRVGGKGHKPEVQS